MLSSTELPCGIKMNSCSYALDLLTRGPLHLSKRWASGWSRPYHLLMSLPVNLPLWLSSPTRPGVWQPPRPWCQEMYSRPRVARLISHRTGTRRYGDVVLTFPKHSYATEFPWKETFGYNCNLGSLKKERTLHSRLYLLCNCKQLAQTF